MWSGSELNPVRGGGGVPGGGAEARELNKDSMLRLQVVIAC